MKSVTLPAIIFKAAEQGVRKGHYRFMSEIVITKGRVIDLRFPTSKEDIGSDAVNKDPDYSAAYCILETDAGVRGFGLTFTLGRGTDLVVLAAKFLARFVEGRTLEWITSNWVAFTRELTGDTQF